ncbi:MAG: extracellular solute-binding protein [Schumannella sp.]
MRKLALAGALGVAAAVVLAGCSTPTPAEEETGDIRVWLVGTDTPQEARDYLKATFEEENPGSTLTIEEQQWTGLVDLLTTSLSSSDSPDVVEVGNTQAAAFTSAGAFLDITDMYEDLGGDDLLPGFVEAGSYDGKFYAAPYYSGSRIVFYNTAQYAQAGVEVPTTLQEYVDNAGKLAAALPGVAGVWYPGQDWYNARALHLGERRRGRRAELGRHLGRAVLEPRIPHGTRAGAGADGELDGSQGRRRVEPVGAVPRGEGRDHLGPELGVLVDHRR